MEVSSHKTSLERRLHAFIVAMPVYVIGVLLLYFVWLLPTASLKEATAFACLVIIPFGEGIIWMFEVLLNSIPEPKKSEHVRKVQYVKISTRLLSVILLIGSMFVWLN